MFDGDAATVGENFGRNEHGEFYSRCRPCKAKHAEQSKAHYARNKETCAAYSKAYREAHNEELSAKARGKIACELCGRVVCRDKMKHHQATLLCEKNKPTGPSHGVTNWGPWN